MDLLGYAAFSGIERVAIIAGALVIGYWGYRLYGRDKAPGLVFMGIACAVLIGALATGASHIRSVGASYQLAGGASTSGAADEPITDDASSTSAIVTGSEAAPTSPFAEPRTDATPSSIEGSAKHSANLSANASADLSAELSAQEDATGSEAPVDSVETTQAQDARPEVALANSRELGGRIVSVKSENITLEWSQEPEDTAAR